MASTPLPPVGEGRNYGLPPTESNDQDSTIAETASESQSIGPNLRTSPHIQPTEETVYAPKPEMLRNDKIVAAVPLKMEAGAQNRQYPPRPPSQPRTPSLGPSIRKRMNDVKNKISNPGPRLHASVVAGIRRLEGTDTGGSRATNGQESPLEPAAAQTSRPEADILDSCVLEQLSDSSILSPSIDIIAIHDQWQTPATAWAYSPSKGFVKPREPLRDRTQASGGTTSKIASTSLPLPSTEKTDANAGSKALGGNKAAFKARLKARKGRKNRLGRDKGRTQESNIESQPDATPADVLASAAAESAALPPDTTAETATGNRPSSALTNPPSTDRMDKREGRLDNEDSPTQFVPPKQGTGAPSEKDSILPSGNWLTCSSMISGDFHGPRVLAFNYKPLELKHSTEGNSKKLDYNRYLRDTAEALFTRIKQDRAQNHPRVPLVFIADGFGCLIVQKFITLIAESGDNSAILDMIAAVVFFDAPAPTQSVPGEGNNTQERPNGTGAIAPPISFGRGARIKNFWESVEPHTWDIWGKFRTTVQRKQLSTLWFYTPSQTSIQQPPPCTDCMHFVALRPFPSKSTGRKSAPRFKGPDDPHYRSLVDYMKRFLLLKASAHHELEGSLVRFINSGYELQVKDHKRRGPLHRAAECANYTALFYLVTASPDLLLEGDEEGSTPLHLVIRRAIRDGSGSERRGPFKEMIKKLLFVLAERQHEDDLKDKSGKSAWEYASGDKHRWIRELRNSGLLNGARAAQPEKIDDSQTPLSKDEDASCRKSDAILAQFYIANDGSTDYWDHQQPEVHMAIYDPKFGVEKLFSMNLRRDFDKLPTCRWIHLPANNIPIFGFERHKYREKLSQQIKSDIRLPGDDETSTLIRAYFGNKKFPLHCRRTLDQFTYHMLKDTESRDNTQVIFKAQDKSYCMKPQLNLQSYRDQGTDIGMWPQLMVDQLWLWILDDEKTVITSVPNTWNSSESFNHVRFLMRNELTENDERPLIEGPWDLANSIIRCSVDFLQRKGPLNATLSECFQSSINVVAAEQAKEFARFQRLVEKLSQREIDQEKRARLTNKLFRLTNATRLLAEIMDIQDELKIINEVLHKQRDGLQKFSQILASEGKHDKTDDDDASMDGPSSYHGSPSPEIDPLQLNDPQGERKRRSPSYFRKPSSLSARRGFPSVEERGSYHNSKPLIHARANLHLVESNIATIEELGAHAEKVRMEINGVLSHRQKHANAWEARFAREGSEYTQRQSNVTLVFTTVTVFFLPLTFMSSILALQIDVFPHNPETGELDWSLGTALSLVFGISFAMISLIALFGFYINRVSRLFWRFFGRATALSIESSEYGHHHDSDSDSDASTASDDSHSSKRSRKSMKLSKRTKNKSKGISENEDLDHAEIQYAPMFGTWHFHNKVPLVRNLWKYHKYPSLPRKLSHIHASTHDAALTARSRGNRDAGSLKGYSTDDSHATEHERDYPIHHALRASRLFASDKILRPIGQLVPNWLNPWKVFMDETEYGNDNNSGYGTAGHPQRPNSAESHQVDVAIGHPSTNEVREKRSEDRKIVGAGVSLSHFGRSKAKEEDPESQLGIVSGV
ncbi:putative ankyrin repeat and protein kinase domain-containing protein 1 [Paramyrothecium foliicola]|nr:putative ankyrin repeat and protein kinase domain-containing protein 1 [Paramyrothecium foliicola]